MIKGTKFQSSLVLMGRQILEVINVSYLVWLKGLTITRIPVRQACHVSKMDPEFPKPVNLNEDLTRVCLHDSLHWEVTYTLGATSDVNLKKKTRGRGEGEIRDHTTKLSLKYSGWLVCHDCRYSDISKEINCWQCFVSSALIFVGNEVNKEKIVSCAGRT